MEAKSSRSVGKADRLEATEWWGFWRLVVPGWPQWCRGERIRGGVLIGSYVSAFAMALFAWGSVLGALVAGVAVVTHVTSIVDVIRRAAFPGFGTWAPWFSAVVGLGMFGYLPPALVGLRLACPVWTADGQGYLVDRSAYLEQGPGPGQWVWLERRSPAEPRVVAQVIAVGGQVVSWSEAGLQIDGQWSPIALGGAEPDRGVAWVFEVPEGTLLIIGPINEGGIPLGPAEGLSEHLAIVRADRAIGRPWARYYPVWSRQFLG